MISIIISGSLGPVKCLIWFNTAVLAECRRSCNKQTTLSPRANVTLTDAVGDMNIGN